MIYFDNNGTTFMDKDAIDFMIKLINIGNPSVCPEAKNILKNARNRIKEILKIPNYNVIFTSGASESNSVIIRMVVENYTLPHIITSSIEHSSILDLMKIMTDKGKIELTLISPNNDGSINPEDVSKAIKSNTKLVSIMYANNELGTINPIKKISKICSEKNIPFFTDATQYLGKYNIHPNKLEIDALSFSFHKCHGPIGCGLLLIHKNMVKNYDLRAIIAGEQNEGLRGGTENISSIGASVYSFEKMLIDRTEKNKYLRSLVAYLRNSLSKIAPCYWHDDWLNNPNLQLNHDNKNIPAIIFLGPKNDKKILPNTQMFSYYYPPNIAIDTQSSKFMVMFCNLKLKSYMMKKNIFISTGSACLKNSSSYVIKQITDDKNIRRGSIRLSFAHTNTKKEIDIFIYNFKEFIKYPMDNYMLHKI